MSDNLLVNVVRAIIVGAGMAGGWTLGSTLFPADGPHWLVAGVAAFVARLIAAYEVVK